MGRSHGLSGAAAGLGLGATTGSSPGVCLLLGGITMIGAYCPDIDHRSSTITRSVPLLGRLASWVVRLASRSVYAATKGPRDENHSGEHRHLSHTVVGALAFGALVGFGMFAALDHFGMGDARRLGMLVGVGIALGCVVHCLGDALTLSGCPFLWPIPIAGETFYELRPPRLLRFRTNGPFERRAMFPALVVATILLIPGVWPLISPLLWDTGHGAVGALR